MPDSQIRLSFLDRILDPDTSTSDGTRSAELLRAGVRRDLDWLLNSRRIAEPAPADFPEVRNSVYHYGIPDVSSRSGDSAAVRRLLARDIQDAVERFEPRLSRVRVTLVESQGEGSLRSIRFTIDALLEMDPEPERVTFDTVLEVGRGEFVVRGGSHA